jgi:hypothetical protein
VTRAATVISAGRSRSSLSITAVNGIIKGWAMSSSTAHHLSVVSIGFAVASSGAGSSILLSRGVTRRDDQFDGSAH